MDNEISTLSETGFRLVKSPNFLPSQAPYIKICRPGCIPAEEMQLVMKHVPGCSAADVDEMIEAIDRQDDHNH